MVWRRFKRHRMALVCSVLLFIVALSTLVVPWISLYTFDEFNADHLGEAPSQYNWFGTDGSGRDVMTRVFYGGRLSFMVGFVATAVSLMIGIPYGAIAGYRGGKTDQVMMRIVDVLYGLPFMIFVIIFIALFGRSILNLFIALGLVQWLTTARIVRGQVLSLKEKEFVEAARAMGVSTWSIISRHMIPNLIGPVIVYATLTIPAVMLEEAFLSFLGLGPSGWPSWGQLLSEGAATISGGSAHWWMVLFPGVIFAATLYCLNTIGDGLRDAFDVG
jgi:oligopeptide transport system permease protein